MDLRKIGCIWLRIGSSDRLLWIWCWTKHHTMKTYWGSGGIAPCILDLDTRWRWVVSFTPRPLYPQGKMVKRKIPSPHWESNPKVVNMAMKLWVSLVTIIYPKRTLLLGVGQLVGRSVGQSVSWLII
jgi:hypothetical protein